MAAEILKRIGDLVAEGEEEDAVEAVKEALAQGISALTVLNEGASKGMDVVSEQYSAGEAFLPELVLAGDAMSAVIKIIFENMSTEEAARSKKGVVVLGQAKGDVHDIGKNIVGALLAVNGFEVHDIGVDAPVKAFFEKAREVNADIVGVSTLLTTSLPFLEDILRYFTDTGNRDKYQYIVGGGPVTSEYAKKIGADGWSRNAFDGVEMCKRLMAMGNPGKHEIVLVDSEKGGM
ncbi:MAG: cobalamin-dependent protein [Treponema sp.]|jgi:methanogenic corrinoid protein MtbC1|nr:cobalamin-dependent protein [Treponema sp.]